MGVSAKAALICVSANQSISGELIIVSKSFK